MSLTEKIIGVMSFLGCLLASIAILIVLSGCATNPQDSRGCYSEMAHSWCKR